MVWGSDGEPTTTSGSARTGATWSPPHSPRMPHLRATRSSAGQRLERKWRTLDKSGVTGVSCPTRPTCASSTRWRVRSSSPPHVAIARDMAVSGQHVPRLPIPLALDAMVESGRGEAQGDTGVLIAFGAGLAYAAQVPEAPPSSATHHPMKLETERRKPAWQPPRRSAPASPSSSTRSPASTPMTSSSTRITDELDVDSLSMVEVDVAAEEKFGVNIPDDEVKNLGTVGDAVGTSRSSSPDPLSSVSRRRSGPLSWDGRAAGGPKSRNR